MSDNPRPPFPDLDFINVTVADVRDDPAGMTFIGLPTVIASAGLEELGLTLMWEGYPQAHDNHGFLVLLATARKAARRVQAGDPPLYAPAAEYAAEPGLFISAYDLYYHPTEDLFRSIADLLTAGGRSDLAEIVLDAMPAAIAAARGRVAPYPPTGETHVPAV